MLKNLSGELANPKRFLKHRDSCRAVRRCVYIDHTPCFVRGTDNGQSVKGKLVIPVVVDKRVDIANVGTSLPNHVSGATRVASPDDDGCISVAGHLFIAPGAGFFHGFIGVSSKLVPRGGHLSEATVTVLSGPLLAKGIGAIGSAAHNLVGVKACVIETGLDNLDARTGEQRDIVCKGARASDNDSEFVVFGCRFV